MSEVFRKQQLKDQDRILVVGAPEEFRPHLKSLSPATKVATSARGKTKYGFALIFVKSCVDIARQAALAGRLEEDGLLWFAYRKKSSKRPTSDATIAGSLWAIWDSRQCARSPSTPTGWRSASGKPGTSSR